MKTTSLCCAVLALGLSTTVSAQEQIIHGTIRNAKPNSKVFVMGQNGSKTDSAMVRNGAFELKVSVSEPKETVLAYDHGKVFSNGVRLTIHDSKTIYMDGSEPIALTTDEYLKQAQIAGGGALQKDFQAYQKSIQVSTDNIYKAYIKYEDAQLELMKLSNESKTATEGYIRANPHSFFSVKSLKQLVDQMGGNIDIAKVKPLYDALDPKLKETAQGKDIAMAMTTANAVAIGKTAPDFTQNDVEGKPVSLKDYRGKYVLIDFWASWCGPCRAENPHVVAAYEQFKNKNFTVLGVSLDDEKGKDAWLKAIEADKLTWTQVSDLKGWNNEAGKLYNVKGIPQNYLIGPDGKILAANLRGDALKKKLAEVLN